MTLQSLNDIYQEGKEYLYKLIQDKKEGEFTHFPIFFPLSEIYLPRDITTGRAIVEMSNVSRALTNINLLGNRTQEFAVNAHWDILLLRISTYMCGIIDNEAIKNKDLSNIYLLIDVPKNSKLISTIKDYEVAQGHTPCYWVVLRPEDPNPPVEPTAPEVPTPEEPGEPTPPEDPVEDSEDDKEEPVVVPPEDTETPPKEA